MAPPFTTQSFFPSGLAATETGNSPCDGNTQLNVGRPGSLGSMSNTVIVLEPALTANA